MNIPVKRISSGKLFQGDRVIWAVFFLLSMISIVEVFSAASSLSYSTGNYMAPLFKQISFLAVGTAVVWFFHAIPCRYFKIIPVVMLPTCIVLLIITLFLGERLNEGSRWLNIFGISFQPSELAKGVVVITVALMLANLQHENGADRRALKYVLTATGIVCLLIFPENLSTAAILFATVYIMMFIGRVPMVQLAKVALFFVAMGLGVLLLVRALPSTALNEVPLLHRAETWVNRVDDHGSKDLSPMEYLEEHPQEAHANIAIASSNIVGKLPGNSEQRDRLAHAYSDFIYAIIIEEMGIWGAFFVVFLYIVLLFRAGRIASRCERNFPAFLIMGLALLMVLQAMVNMLVAVGLVPITGQPLPLISRGGTSTIINCIYFGMMLSVSPYARRNRDAAAKSETPAAAADPLAKEFQSNVGLI